MSAASVQVTPTTPTTPRVFSAPPPRFPHTYGSGGSEHQHHHNPHHHHHHNFGHPSGGHMMRSRMSFQSYRLYPRTPLPPPGSTPSGGDPAAAGNTEYDGRRLRKSLVRKTVDYNAAIIRGVQNRVWQRDHRDRRALEPDYSYAPDTVPPTMLQDNPSNSVTTRYVKSATNKMRCPIFSMAWTPEGRRLVTGASSGEFTLWNGLTFNFETILQAHDSPVRSMVWSHNDIWMVTGDHAGYVKYWQSNMNNVKMYQAHKEAIRGLSFSPSDQKFASCSDDGTVRVWDFYTCFEEKVLRGHGADVKCVDWHPHKGIIVSGSKDNQQPVKIWDPKAGIPLATIHAHKSTVMDARWNRNGNWLITASRDHLIKLFDIRKLSQEVQVFRGHKKESSCLAWHPVHENLFASGGSDGSILFWNVGCDKEVGSIENAHDNIIWTLAWHPVGHILCSGSNDHTSKFWTRQKPGDIIRDKGHGGTFHDYANNEDNEMEEAFIPGMGPEDKVEANEDEKEEEVELVIPGLDLTEADPSTKPEKPLVKKTPYQKPIPKKFQAIWNDAKVEDELEDDRGRGDDPFQQKLKLEREIPVSNTNINTQRPPIPDPPSPTTSSTFGPFNPNVGFGPMGTQYISPSSASMVGPTPSQQMGFSPSPNGPPPRGPQFQNNNSQNPFWGNQNLPAPNGPGPGRGHGPRLGGMRGMRPPMLNKINMRSRGGTNLNRGGWNR